MVWKCGSGIRYAKVMNAMGWSKRNIGTEYSKDIVSAYLENVSDLIYYQKGERSKGRWSYTSRQVRISDKTPRPAEFCTTTFF